MHFAGDLVTVAGGYFDQFDAAPGAAFAVRFRTARLEGRLDRSGRGELRFDGRDWRMA